MDGNLDPSPAAVASARFLRPILNVTRAHAYLPLASAEAALGRRVIVVPMRVAGFGPYADVLEGLEYTAAEGLLPHPLATSWVRETAARVACRSGWADCG